ncbi:MAG: ABC transporter permease, partial [Yoonia sp.]
NPKAIFGEWALDLPWIIPVLVGLGVGLIAGCINGLLVAFARIPPFIATLGMMLFARGVAQWWSRGNPVSFPTESYAKIGAGMMPVIIFLSLAVLFHFIMNYTVYGKHTYAIGSNEQAARMSGINVPRHLVLVYIIAGMLAGLAAVILTSKNLTAQSGMGLTYELEAIAMAVIGGVSLFGGRGSIIGTVIGALIIGVITSGFTFLKLGAFYQEMVLGMIIVSAVALDQWQQQRAASRA